MKLGTNIHHAEKLTRSEVKGYSEVKKMLHVTRYLCTGWRDFNLDPDDFISLTGLPRLKI